MLTNSSCSAGGAYAEFCAVHADALIELPEKLSFDQGAAVAEAYLTAYQVTRDARDLMG